MALPCEVSVYPHFNYTLQPVSRDLGFYGPIVQTAGDCANASYMLTYETCLNSEFLGRFGIDPGGSFDIQAFFSQTNIPPEAESDDDWTNYVQSLSNLMTVTAILAVLLILVDFGIIVSGCCCCCCRWCRKGLDPRRLGNIQKYGLLSVFLILASALLTRAEFLGSLGITNGMSWVATHPPSAAGDLAKRIPVPFRETLVPGWASSAQDMMRQVDSAVAQLYAEQCGSSARRLLAADGEVASDMLPGMSAQTTVGDECANWAFFSQGSGPGSLADFLEQTSTAEIDDRLRREGVVPSIVHIFAELGIALENLGVNGAINRSAISWRDTVSELLVDMRRQMDALEDLDGDSATYGDVWYLATLWNEFSELNYSYAHPEAFDNISVEQRLMTGTRFNAQTIVPYENGTLCLSDTCVQNEIRSFNRDGWRHFGLETVYSREGVYFAAITPMILIVICAFIVLFTGNENCGMCVSSCTLLWLPVAFLVILPGVPFSIFLEDVCNSAQSLAVKNARVFIPGTCSEYDELAGPVDRCTMYLPRLHTTLTDVPFLSLVDQVFSDTVLSAGDPFEVLWNELRVASVPTIRGNITELLQGQLEETLDPRLLDRLPAGAIDDTIDGMATSVQDTITGLASILTGESLSSVRAVAMGGVCCMLTRSFTVYNEAVAALAVVGLLFGVPGGGVIIRGYFQRGAFFDVEGDDEEAEEGKDE